jgi:hypothetical protein
MLLCQEGKILQLGKWRRNMKLKAVYLLLCIMGAVLPYAELVPWVLRNGLKMQGFFQLLFANRVSAFFAMDVLVSSLVLWLFVRTEGRRLGVRRLWLPLLGLLTVGVSLGFPLFLYLREIALDAGESSATSRAG